MIEYRMKNKSLSHMLDKVMYSQSIRFNLDSSRRLSTFRHHYARLNAPSQPNATAQSSSEHQDRESAKSHDKIYAAEPFQALDAM